MSGQLNGPLNASERARIASNRRWSKPGERERQSAALVAGNRRFAERQVDPDGVMSPDELDAAVRNYYRERMARVRAGKRAS